MESSISIKSVLRKVVAAAVLSLAAGASQASIVDSGTVNGLRTFTDPQTGLIWLDMDNFFDSATGNSTFTGLEAIAAAEAAGFTLASRVELNVLLSDLPLGEGQWASYAALMDFGDPRDMIWGVYELEEEYSEYGDYGWAWTVPAYSGWRFGVAYSVDLIAAGNPQGQQDLGVWAYRRGGDVEVPEPFSIGLLGLGLLGLAATRRRR